MSQNFAALVGKGPTGTIGYLNTDTEGNLLTTSGDTASALNKTAAAVIKATPGRLGKLLVVSGGTASNGSFVFNDCATTGAAAAANEIFAIPSGAAAGTVYDLQWPCLTGIVMSAVPTAGSPIINISYT